MLLQRHPSRILRTPSEPPVATAPTAEQLARNYLEIARLFVAYGKTRFARRRLKLVIDRCGDSPAALESRTLLASIDSEPAAAPAE